MSSCVIMAKHLRESFSSICINRSKAKQPKLDSTSDPIISWIGKYSHPILASLHHQCLVLVINSPEVFLPTTLQVVRASIYKPIMKTPVESQDIALAVLIAVHLIILYSYYSTAAYFVSNRRRQSQVPPLPLLQEPYKIQPPLTSVQ